MVPASNRGLAYGDGVFETMRYRVDKQAQTIDIALWAYHYDRLQLGLDRLNIPFDPTSIMQHIQATLEQVYAVIEQSIDPLITTSSIVEGVCKLIVEFAK